MVFSSNIFLFLFLPLTFALYFALPAGKIAAKNAILLVFSLIFYAWGEISYFALLIFSIAGNYFFGLWLDRKNTNLRLALALIFNLALLLYFKYAPFIAQNLAQIGLEAPKSLLPHHLPIGISFFTFHAISYLVDIYRQKSRAQRNFLTLALYIAFFPQLVAGPIVRYNFIEKYLSKRRQSWFFTSYGLRRFIIGLGKKVIIANTLGQLADAIFAAQITEISSATAWIGLICYSLQIYFDFSGYSDMAVGLARIFGFKFPENFNYPYISKSIKEFWRRWHMSLSAWFRDYLYIPLGGNRVALAKQYFNLILVFFLCGLWHGASWNFIIWGLFHGFFLVIERIHVIDKILTVAPKFLRHFYAMFVVSIAWVFFRSPDLSHSTNFLTKMFSFESIKIEASSEILRLIQSNFTLTAFALAIIGFSPFVRDFCLKLMRKNKIFIIICDFFLILTLIFAAMRLSASTHNPFIYFQF